MIQAPKRHPIPKKYYVAVGSNLGFGDSVPLEFLEKVVSVLMTEAGCGLKQSRYYQSPAFPKGSGPDYVNAVWELSIPMVPQGLMELLHGLEARFGRVRTTRWAARSLDLDLIACGDVILPDATVQTYWRQLPLAQQMELSPQELILPHPRLQDRAFVLVPLAELAPDWRHPLIGRTAQEMRDALPPADIAALHALD